MRKYKPHQYDIILPTGKTVRLKDQSVRFCFWLSILMMEVKVIIAALAVRGII